MKRTVFITLVGLLAVMCSGIIGTAQEDENIDVSVRKVRVGSRNPVKNEEIDEEDITVTTRKIKGRVNLIRPGYISITHKEDRKKKSSYAIDVRIDEDEISLSRIKSLDEIKVGDIVEIECEETKREYEKEKKDGTKEKAVNLMGRKAKRIIFVSSGTSSLSSGR